MPKSVILLISDDPARTEHLADVLAPLGGVAVCGLDDDAWPSNKIRMVISDVSLAKPGNVGALRQKLAHFKGQLPFFVCVLREETVRGETQANALRANVVVPASAGPEAVLMAIRAHLAAGVRDQSAAPLVAAAGKSLTEIFAAGRSGKSIAPAMVSAGAQFIEDALRDMHVRDWLDVVWQFDDATLQHCMIVAGLAAAFALDLGFNHADTQRLTSGALLHDVGKSRIPAHILNKPGRLDAGEISIMRMHAAIGYDLLVNEDYSRETLAVVRSHHEKLDGSGYPDGLRGDAIPDLVRLITICDIFGALIERRPYKTPMSGDQAYAILDTMEGELDEDLLRAFKPVAMAADEPALLRRAG